MPARTTRPELRRPGCFAFFRRFPKHKVSRIFFILSDNDACASNHVVEFSVIQFAIRWKRTHPKINIARVALISGPVFDESVNKVEHRLNVRSRSRLQIRRQAAEFLLVAMHEIDHFGCELRKINTTLCCAGKYLVVDICDVSHVVHIKTTKSEISNNGVKGNHDTAMTQMAAVIYRHPANIDTNFFSFHRLKVALFSGQGVKDLQTHALFLVVKPV